MRIHLITGATGTGKTDLATEMARRYDVPVVVLDRYQVFSELAIGTGRPHAREWAGTERIYLCDRRIAEGELHPEVAERYLLEHLAALGTRRNGHDRRRHRIDCILEGGSISLLRLLFGGGALRDHEVSLECLSAGSPHQYRQKQRSRVLDWFDPASRGGHTIETEARQAMDAWPERADFLESIVSYRALLRRARTSEAPSGAVREELVDDLVAYGREQDAFMTELSGRTPSTGPWRGTGTAP